MLDDILEEIAGALASSQGIEDALRVLDRYRYPLAERIAGAVSSDTAAKAIALKLLNYLLARHQFRRRATALVARPFGLVVDPTNSCNLGCPGCVHSPGPKANGVFDWNPGTLGLDRFGAIVRHHGPFAVQTVFCNYGEPTLNLRTPEMIREAKGYLCQTMLSTNMTAPRFDAAAYASCGLDYIIVSIDGATQPVYERFRRRGKLETALANLRALIEEKRRTGRATPMVCWRFLVFEHNVHEVDAAREMAFEMGCDEFHAANPWDIAWDDPAIRPARFESQFHVWNENTRDAYADNFLPDASALQPEEIGEEFETSWVNRLDPALTPEANGMDVPSRHACHWLYQNMVADANGRVFPCCGPPSDGVDLVFAKAWTPDAYNAPRYRQARAFFATGQRQPGTEPYCVRCEWTQEAATIDTTHVRSYLEAGCGGIVGPEAMDRVCVW